MSESRRSGDAPRRPAPLPGSQWGFGTVVLLAVSVWLLLQLHAVLVVIVGSVLFAALLDPAVGRLSDVHVGRSRLGRPGAAALVVFGSLLVIALLVYLLAPLLWEQLTRLAQNLPGYALDARARVLEHIRRTRILPRDAALAFEGELARLLSLSGKTAATWVVSLAGNVLQLLGLAVIPLGTFYILADNGRLRRDLLASLPPQWRPRADVLLERSGWALSAYVRGQVAVCASSALLYAVVFTLLGVPYAIALGAVAGLAEAVPFLGGLLVAIVVGVTGLAAGVGVAARGLLGFIVANQIVNYVISPRLMSRNLDLHPFYVILAALAGATLAGPLGALLALPTAAVVQTLVHRAWAPPREPAARARRET